MAGSGSRRSASLIVGVDQPLIGLISQRKGREVVRYFAGEAAADAAAGDDVLQQALATIGAWSDLDWADMEQALDRIRHESEPSPPLEL